MRVYLSPAIQQLISTLVLLVSLGAAGFVVWKAVEFWQADPTLEQLQEMTQPNQP